MKENIKLAILGGDARQSCLAAMLADRGFECAVWGVCSNGESVGSAVRCRDWISAVRSASAVILPLPASTDGVSVNCPSATSGGREENLKLKLNTLLDAVNVPIFGGRFSEAFLASANEKGRKVIDYFDSETLQIRNATPTAEGAISVAMSHLKITLCECRAVVVGYGRIGQRLSHLLGQMGARVTVAARGMRSLAQAASFGYSTMRIMEGVEGYGLNALCEYDGYDVIFNTVPVRIFDHSLLSRLPKNILLIDLASVPGGVDFLAAKEEDIRAVWALSLPGKYAPVSAGRIIGETLLEYLESEGIV